jgi:hypothetical protein
MSTDANGTQQTYEEIWASMERSCAGLTAALRTSAPQATSAEVTPAATDRPGRSAASPRRRYTPDTPDTPGTPRRSARGRRRIAARNH